MLYKGPDVGSLPKLAEALGVSVDELKIISLIWKAIPLAMGVAVVGIGIFCLALGGERV